MIKQMTSIALCLLLAGNAFAESGNNLLLKAIQGEHRAEENKARDQYRNPYETLRFFGIQPHHRVVEIYPGTGWYTDILAPYLREHGQLIAATYPRGEDASDFMRQLNASYDENLAAYPGVFDQVELVGLTPGERGPLAEPSTVDVIFDSRNAHNWINWGAGEMLAAYHNALRPGGVVAVIDHRQEPGAEDGDGYIKEQTLIEVFEANGFRFVESAEVNANPQDTKDHPGGVWNLPPNLRDVPEEEQDHYLAIGESDRLTMKFVKEPLQ